MESWECGDVCLVYQHASGMLASARVLDPRSVLPPDAVDALVVYANGSVLRESKRDMFPIRPHHRAHDAELAIAHCLMRNRCLLPGW